MLNQEVVNRKDEYKDFFNKHGWVSIASVLDEKFAEQELAKYIAYKSWEIVTKSQGQPFIVPIEEFKSQPPAIINKFINDAVMYAASDNFQYFYENVRLQGDGCSQDPIFSDILNLYRNTEYVELLRYIVGSEAIDEVVEAQLTKYTASYFLKQHDDGGPSGDKKRHAAFVMGFSKNWNADWGGLLHIQNEDNSIYKSLVPGFNQLNIFAVPRKHCVSQISNFCPSQRIAISGWLAGGAAK